MRNVVIIFTHFYSSGNTVMHPTDLFIDVGSVYLSAHEMRLSVDKLITHPQYNNPKHQNDIGLIRLTKDIKFTPNAKSIELVSFDRDFEGTLFTVTGWGKLRVNIRNISHITFKIV